MLCALYQLQIFLLIMEGIGAEASRSLVKGIAKYGKGYAEFVRSGERLEGPVMRQLKRALQPVLNQVSIDWGTLPVTHSKVPRTLPPLFNGDMVTTCAFLEEGILIEIFYRLIELITNKNYPFQGQILVVLKM